MVTAARDKLLASIAEIERDSMGLNVLPPIWTWVRVQVLLPILTWSGVSGRADVSRVTNPWRAGLTIVVTYIVVFIGLPYLVYSILVYFKPHDLKLNFNHGLYALQLYGALWAGWATVSTNIVARSLCRTIRTEIAPRLQDQTSKAITRWIRANFGRRAVLCRSWAVGVLCSIIAGVLIFGDLRNVTRLEVTFWSLGWCLLFATSTGVVIVGRFYSAFATHLDQEVASLYVIDPTQSSLLRSVDSLGQRMLLFWFLIAVSIALIYVPKTLLALELSHSRFIIVEVALAGFFSIGVGTCRCSLAAKSQFGMPRGLRRTRSSGRWRPRRRRNWASKSSCRTRRVGRSWRDWRSGTPRSPPPCPSAAGSSAFSASSCRSSRS